MNNPAVRNRAIIINGVVGKKSPNRNITLPIKVNPVNTFLRPCKSLNIPIGTWNNIAPRLNAGNINVILVTSKPFLKPYTGKLLCKPASNNPYNNGNINAIQEVLITSPKFFNVLIMLIGRTLDDGNSLCINKTKEIVIMDRIADKINGNVSETSTS